MELEIRKEEEIVMLNKKCSYKSKKWISLDSILNLLDRLEGDEQLTPNEYDICEIIREEIKGGKNG